MINYHLPLGRVHLGQVLANTEWHREKGNISDCSLASGEISNKITIPAMCLLGTQLQALAAKRWVCNPSSVTVLWV